MIAAGLTQSASTVPRRGMSNEAKSLEFIDLKKDSEEGVVNLAGQND
jgi:hypothetical protein